MALAAVAQNWGLRQNKPVEGVLLLLSGLLLVFPSLARAPSILLVLLNLARLTVPLPRRRRQGVRS